MAMIIYQYLAVAAVLSTTTAVLGAWNVVPAQEGDRRSVFPPYAVERRDVLAAFGGAAAGSTMLHPLLLEANAADSAAAAAMDGKLRLVELLWDDCPTVSRKMARGCLALLLD
jgi:hypothetical protein